MHRSKIVALALFTAAGLAAADFSGASALEFTAKAVAFGPRPAGSEANQKLQSYIAAQLRGFGWNVQEDSFVADTPLGQKTMKNIIAKRSGSSGKALVVSGHFDTKLMPLTPFVGANDGGSSTGLLLELARVLAKQSRKDDLYLVWFDGEEAFVNWTDTDSVYGSRHLAAKWAADGTAQKIKALINVDMIGDRDLELVNEVNSAEGLRKLVWETAADLGYAKQFPRDMQPIADDHIPFVRLGVNAIDLIDFDYGPGHSYWHNRQDTLDKLSAASFDVMGKVILEVLHKLETK
ncbi:MAG: M28 family peptidase [Bryobacteraceae bacterium]